MYTLLTGAAGFVGGALLRRLRDARGIGDSLIATDLAFDPGFALPGSNIVPEQSRIRSTAEPPRPAA